VPFAGRLFTLTHNGLGLCEEAELEAQMLVLVQMFIRMPNVQFSTEPAFLQNPCYGLVFSLQFVGSSSNSNKIFSVFSITNSVF
jgi:hypothetical protein